MKLVNLVFTAVILTANAAFAAGIVNGDFELGLNIGWTTTGVVQRIDDGMGNHFARVADNPNPPLFSTLTQTFTCKIDTDGDVCRVEFDVLGGLLVAGGKANVIIYPPMGDPIGLFLKNNTLTTKDISAKHYAYDVGPCGESYKIEVYVDPGLTSSIDVDNFTSACVPEPASCVALVGGLAAFGFRSLGCSMGISGRRVRSAGTPQRSRR